MDSIIEICMWALAACFATLIIVVAIIAGDSVRRRKLFMERYGLWDMPRSIAVRQTGAFRSTNSYSLRRRGEGRSTLLLDDYEVSTTDPVDLVEVVNDLRKHGTDIEPCMLELKKRETLESQRRLFAESAGVTGIFERYSDDPRGFEVLCAKLFEKIGYDVRLTPPTNDGGYDISLRKGNDTTVVECKCYAAENKVGRPSVQKLVGANDEVLADHMLFVTTSDYTTGAVAYAKNVGVELISGKKLFELLAENGFTDKTRIDVTPVECWLNASDVYDYL